MLVELLENGYGNEHKLNCAQKILHASNEVYELGLTEEGLKLSCGFGSGMGAESTCGALTGAVMVLGKLFPIKDDERKKHLYSLTNELIETFRQKMGYIDCAPLKKDYRRDDIGCKHVIVEAAKILDSIVKRELKKD